MTKDLSKIQNILIALLKKHIGDLKITKNTNDNFEVSGTIEAMQGKKKVNGIYFASIVPKPKDIRFYFFPIYTHKNEIGELPDNLKKCLKGKSCFHVKYMDVDLQGNFQKMIDKGVQIFKKSGLLKK